MHTELKGDTEISTMTGIEGMPQISQWIAIAICYSRTEQKAICV